MKLFVEKYKPDTISFNTINKMLKEDNISNLLFYGISGTGKTSTIHLISDLIYGKEKTKMVVEINGSFERGVDVFKNSITRFCKSKSFLNIKKKKMVIIDEADSLTPDSQKILQDIIKKFSHKVTFCIMCNYLNNLDTSLKSLCNCYNFKPLSEVKYTDILQNIVETENIVIGSVTIEDIYKITNKDIRKGINILQILGKNEITDVYNFFNYPSDGVLDQIIHILFSGENLLTKVTSMIQILEKEKLLLKKIIPLVLKKIIEDKNYGNIDKLKKIIKKSHEIEENISKDHTFKIQLLSYICIFH